MAGASNLKILLLHPFHLLSSKLSLSSSLTSKNLKTLIHSIIFSHIRRILRALSKAKSIVMQILSENQPITSLIHSQKHKIYEKKKKKNRNKVFFGSFRLHYNWCSSSSHVMPVPAPERQCYHDSTWNSLVCSSGGPCEEGCGAESQLSAYLHWLEERKTSDGSNKEEPDVNEIDKLAELFIASCHEKFLLEKQESYRRFQEMLARSL